MGKVAIGPVVLTIPVRPDLVSCIAPKSFGLDSRQAAVDRKVDTGDVAALVRGEEQSRRRDLFRMSRLAGCPLGFKIDET